MAYALPLAGGVDAILYNRVLFKRVFYIYLLSLYRARFVLSGAVDTVLPEGVRFDCTGALHSDQERRCPQLLIWAQTLARALVRHSACVCLNGCAACAIGAAAIVLLLSSTVETVLLYSSTVCYSWERSDCSQPGAVRLFPGILLPSTTLVLLAAAQR